MTAGLTERETPANDAETGPDEDTLRMRRFYAGDEPAFNEIVQRWRRPLYAFFYRMGFIAEDADDLTQDVLLRLYFTRDRTNFKLDRPVAPFLWKVARNLASTHRERAASRPRQLPFEGEDLGTADTAAVSNALQADLLECAKLLPEAQRVYLMLCGHHGLGEASHNEICAMLGKWPSQVSELSKRTLRNLRSCLQKKGYRFNQPES